MSGEKTGRLPEQLRAAPIGDVVTDALDWASELLAAAEQGELAQDLHSILYPAVFSDLFEELEGADETLRQLSGAHAAGIAAARRAVAGETLDGDQMLAVAAIAGRISQLASTRPGRDDVRAVTGLLHAWAVSQVVAQLDSD